MSQYVVDANVVAKWFVPERLSEEALRLLDGAHELATPDLMWPEIGNVLWRKAQARELTRRQAGRIIEALEQCPLAVFPSRHLFESALEIALHTGRSVMGGRGGRDHLRADSSASPTATRRRLKARINRPFQTRGVGAQSSKSRGSLERVLPSRRSRL